MLAFLAAVVFGIELIVKPHWNVSLTVLGLFLIALHLAFGTVVTGVWSNRNRISR